MDNRRFESTLNDVGPVETRECVGREVDQLSERRLCDMQLEGSLYMPCGNDPTRASTVGNLEGRGGQKYEDGALWLLLGHFTKTKTRSGFKQKMCTC